MKNLKIAQKLAVGFGTILVMFIISVIFAVFSLRSVANDLDLFYNRPFMNVALAMQIDMNSEVAAKDMLRSCVEQNMTETNNLLNSASSYIQKMTTDLATLKSNYTGDVSEITTVENYVSQLNQSFTNLAAASRSNNVTEAYRIYTTEISDLLVDITNAIGIVRDHASNVASDSYTQGMSSSRITLVMLIVMGILAVIVGSLLAVYITHALKNVIIQLQEASQRMSQGDFNVTVTYESADELGVLSASMRQLVNILKTVIRDIGNMLGELANGNLAISSSAEKYYVGDLKPIITAFHKMKLDLNHTMGGIVTSSDQVNAGADQVSAGAQGLAQGATEQASAVQELAATINEISQNISLTADHAEVARTENLRSHDELQMCSKLMDDLVHAMQSIEEKSNEVSKISKAIEDIAFQTNILALNAAVEAARAGNAGKGFAVVADEVRNLASKSAEAAKSTTVLIGETIQAVDRGTKISDETGKSLSNVVTNSKTVLDAVVNIAEAVQQQSESIKQITQGIDQISSVVQTNSATAEQSAAASEELSGQAQMLKNLVSIFTLDASQTGNSLPSHPAF